MPPVDTETFQRRQPLVLAVYENEEQAANLRKVLGVEGYSIEVLTSEREILDTAIRDRPDVIVLDLDSPTVAGLGLCEQLRGMTATEDIPVILQTGHHRDPNKIVEGLSRGGFDYLIKPYNDREFVARVGVMTRISQMLRRDRHLAMTDELTGLLNRRSLFERLREELDRARRYQTCVSCIMLDLDHFKHVNDTYGHAGGDEVLRMVAQFIKTSRRLPDVVGRYGGEEFLILLPETPADGALSVAERIRSVIGSNKVIYKDFEIPVTASLGVATSVAEHSEDSDQLLQRADQALYQAKAEGRNRTILAKLPHAA